MNTEIDRIPIPCNIVFPDGIVSYSDIQNERNQPLKPFYTNRKGTLRIGNIPIGNAEFNSKGDSIKIEALSISDEELRNQILKSEISILAELDRKNFEPDELSNFRDGSVILFRNNLAGMPINLYTEDSDIWLGKGEVAVIDEKFCIRLTNLDNSFSTGSQPILANHPSIRGKLILGKSSISYSDFLSLKEGSELFLDSFEGDLAQLQFDDGSRLWGEILVFNEEFGFRVIDSSIGILDIEDENTKQKEDDNTVSNTQSKIREIEKLFRNSMGDFNFRNFRKAVNLVYEISTANNDYSTIHNDLCKIKQLNEIDPMTIFESIKGEHPQIIALILRFMETDCSTVILSKLADELIPDIVDRISKIKESSRAQFLEIATMLEVKIHLAGYDEAISKDGVATVSKIMENLDGKDKDRIKNIIDKKTT